MRTTRARAPGLVGVVLVASTWIVWHPSTLSGTRYVGLEVDGSNQSTVARAFEQVSPTTTPAPVARDRGGLRPHFQGDGPGQPLAPRAVVDYGGLRRLGNGQGTAARNLFVHSGHRNLSAHGGKINWVNNAILGSGPDDRYTTLSFQGIELNANDSNPSYALLGVGVNNRFLPSIGTGSDLTAGTQPSHRTFDFWFIPENPQRGDRIYLNGNLGPYITGPTGPGQWSGIHFEGGVGQEVLTEAVPEWYTAQQFEAIPTESLPSALAGYVGARPADSDSVNSLAIGHFLAAAAGDNTRMGSRITRPEELGLDLTLQRNLRTLDVPANPHEVVDAAGRTRLEGWLEAQAQLVERAVDVPRVELTANRPAPQSAGTPIAFTATATGEGGPHQFKFRVFDGALWTIVQDWGASSTLIWQPTQANAAYRVGVWVRNAATTTDSKEASAEFPFAITASAARLQVGLTANRQPPQPVGTRIRFTAAATGGQGSYQYKWWVFDGVAWRIVQDWGASSTLIWQPTQANAAYRVGVWVRNAATTTDSREASAEFPFAITASAARLQVGLTANRQPPQPVGTRIRFTAAATGGQGSYQYKWWVFDGVAWRIVQDWGASSTLIWQPTQANAAYRVGVWVRNAATTTDTWQAATEIVFEITQGIAARPATTTWYVNAATGHDTNNDCTAAQNPAHPKQTIAAGIACVIGTGNTVEVADGTYPEALSSFPAGPLTIRSAAPRGAIIQPSGDIEAFNMSNESDITIDGFVLDGTNSTATLLYVDGGSGLVVTNNEFRNVNGGLCDGATDSQAIFAYQMTGATVRGNYFHDIRTACSYSHGTYWASHDSVIDGNTYVNLGGGCIQVYSFYPLDLSDNVIRNNVCIDFYLGGEIAGAGLVTNGVDNRVYNNIIYSTTGGGLQSGLDALGPGTDVYHNTLFNLGYTGIQLLGNTTGIVRNNIVWDVAAENIDNVGGSNSCTDNRSNGTVDAQCSATETGDPLFANEGTFDLTLTPGSPAIDTGFSLTGIVDFDQLDVPRPQSAGHDLGAYEDASTAPAPLQVELTANREPPQVAGTAITFTAIATGGTSPYQYKWWVYDGASWVIVQDWSASSTFTWQPALVNPAYIVGVWVRNASTTADTWDAATEMPFPITESVPLQVVLTANRPAPQATGTAITFTAAANGGVAPYQYKFLVSDGATSTVVQDWSTASTFTWQPAVANAAYVVAVWGRSATTTTDTEEASARLPFAITASTTLQVRLTANRAAPQPAGTETIFTAAASGGEASYQYKWWVYDGVAWTIALEWSAANSRFTWQPTTANAAYIVGVWVRNASATADTWQAAAELPFAITAAAPLQVGLTADRQPPQPAGTAVTFTAAATGGQGSYQYKWWVYDGAAWTIVRDWSTGSTFTWQPATANAAYIVAVWVRNASETTDTWDTATQMAFPITAPPPLQVGLTANRTAPQPAGTAITFTAAASGGTSPYQYKWWVYDGATWTIVRDWSTSSTFTWQPATGNAAYSVAVWVRNASTTTDTWDAATQMAFPITAPPPLQVGLTANRTAPQPAGTAITFTAAASGGTSPYQYKWWVFDGATWTIVRDWSTGSTFTWQPAMGNAAYSVAVWVRNASTTTDTWDAATQMAFPITAPPPLQVGLTANRTAPQPAGTAITFTAAASGGTSPYQYKWWVFDGATWTIVRDWSTGSTFTWQPATANAAYSVAVWVRNASTTTDTWDAATQMAFPITAPPPLQVALTANRTAPQPTGTAITFTAAASGGTSPYQYKWWVFDGVTWTIVRDWSTSSTFTWQPATANAAYIVGVWVRNASTTTDTWEAATQLSFAITAPPPLQVGLTANRGPTANRDGDRLHGGGEWRHEPLSVQVVGLRRCDLDDRAELERQQHVQLAAQAGKCGLRAGVWVRNAATTTDTKEASAELFFEITPR